MKPNTQISAGARKQAGMTMVELLVAIVVLMIGVLAVAKLVPAALTTNFRARYDTTALVLAEQQLAVMTSQDLDVGNPLLGGEYWFTSNMPEGVNPVTFSLGARHPNATALPGVAPTPASIESGTALAVNTLTPDWPAGRVAGYWNTYSSPEGHSYETRWNVRTFFQTIDGNIVPVAKRIVISTRGGPANPGGGRLAIPVTLVTTAGWR